MAKKQSGVSLLLSEGDAAVMRLASNVQLDDLKMLGCRAGMQAGKLEPNQLPSDLKQRINIQAATEENSQIILIITFSLTASENEDDEKALLLFEATFWLKYLLVAPMELNAELVQLFGQRNGMLNIWPYWREFIQTMTARMDLPQLKVPLLSPGGLKFEKDSPDHPPKRATKKLAAPRKKPRT